MRRLYFLFVMLCLMPTWLAHAAPAAKPSPTPKERPAISIFRVTCREPGHIGRGSGITFGGMGPTYDRITGTVWFANDTNDTLTDVKLSIEFYNTVWYRSDGSKDYVIGKLDPKQSQSLEYRWENWQGYRVVPKVTVTYKRPGDDALHTVRWDNY